MPRSAIQANEQVYVIAPDETIEFRDIEILRTVDEEVYVSAGIRPGEIISLSTIENAIEGMRVRPVAEVPVGGVDRFPEDPS